MNKTVNQTAEVERRSAAIAGRATDCCGFFARRAGARLTMRARGYCAHGSFQQDTDNPCQPGFCNFNSVAKEGAGCDTK